MTPWPEGPQRVPSEEDMLAPLIDFLARRVKWARRRSNDRVVAKGPELEGPVGEGAVYDGFPVTAASCEDPERFFSDEHLAARALRSQPCTNLLEMVVYAAFRLGVLSEQRRRRQEAAPVQGGAKKRQGRERLRREDRERRYY